MEFTAKHSEIHECSNAPAEFLAWARANSRTYRSISAVNPEWIMWMADNQTAPAGVLNFLKGNSDWHVRALVALNINTPIKALDKLKKDPNEITEHQIALETSSTRTRFLAEQSLAFGRPVGFEEQRQGDKNVTQYQVQAFAESVFDQTRSAFCMMGAVSELANESV